MLKFLDATSNAIRAVVSLVVVAAMGLGGWLGYRTYNASEIERQELAASRQTIVRLQGELEEKSREIERLDTALRLLKVDRRLAHVDVLEKSTSDDGLATRFSFVEVDDEGRPLETPRVFTIDGDVLYIDAYVVKFRDEFVEQGDPLRGTSLVLFRRLFGEQQKPSAGYRLDPVGSRPAAYSRGSEMSDLERELWSNFWEYANDPRMADEAGVRAAHGDAPYVKLMEGKRYKIEVRSSGGLSITAEELPEQGSRAL